MALLGTYNLTANTQQFQEDRHKHESFLQEGVIAAGDYKVTPGGASLQWSVAAGMAWVLGDTTARQGLYPQANDAAVTGTVAAGHATNPRLDQVVLQIADSSVTGVSNTPTLVTVAGTATGGATLDNRTGAAALPASALLLADILVPATHSGVLTTGMIRDRRRWARGAFRRITPPTGADYTTTGAISGTSDIDATNLKPRIECTGNPIRVTFVGRAWNTSAGGNVLFYVSVDGVAQNVQHRHGSVAASNGIAGVLAEDVIVPAAGSRVMSITWGTTGGTATISRAASNDVPMLVIEELVRQNADNS